MRFARQYATMLTLNNSSVICEKENAMPVRLNIHVDDEVPDMLAALAGSQKKMGQYLSSLIRQIHAGQERGPSGRGGPGELEMVSAAVKHLSAKVKELEGRMIQLEEGRH